MATKATTSRFGSIDMWTVSIVIGIVLGLVLAGTGLLV